MLMLEGAYKILNEDVVSVADAWFDAVLAILS